jgi:hypothetical protein
MILAEGTNVDIFQSVMPKPPNIRPVYPLVNRNNYIKMSDDGKMTLEKMTEIMLPESFRNVSHITVFNVEFN